jgi:hypothetical protein
VAVRVRGQMAKLRNQYSFVGRLILHLLRVGQRNGACTGRTDNEFVAALSPSCRKTIRNFKLCVFSS